MRRREFFGFFCGAVAFWPLSVRAQLNPESPSARRLCLPGLQRGGSFPYRCNNERAACVRLCCPDTGRTCGSNCGRRSESYCPAGRRINWEKCEGDHREWPSGFTHSSRGDPNIPIVAIDLETDPVASGVATSLGRPGGNVTGVFLDFPGFTTKWVELLLESNPKLSRMAVLWDPVTGPVQVESVKKVIGSLNIQLVTLEVRRPSDFEEAFSTATQPRADAMVMLSSPLISANVQKLAELSVRHRLAVITLFPDSRGKEGLWLTGQICSGCIGA
jgi:hypothetical protein